MEGSTIIDIVRERTMIPRRRKETRIKTTSGDAGKVETGRRMMTKMSGDW